MQATTSTACMGDNRQALQSQLQSGEPTKKHLALNVLIDASMEGFFDLSALFCVNCTTDIIAKGTVSLTSLLYRLLTSALLLEQYISGMCQQMLS